MLTDAGVKGAQPRAAVYELDADGQGLVLRVTPAGAKSWSLRYRTRTGDRRRITIGRYPDMKLSKARSEAAAIRDRVRLGHDPNEEKAADREALRMVDLLGAEGGAGWYLETYVQTAGKVGKAKSPNGIAIDRYQIAKHLRSRKGLMRKRVADVTKPDLERVKADVPPSVWRKLRNILLVCSRHAEEIGAIPAGSNPAARTKSATDAKRERFLTPDERKRLADTLAEMEELGPHRQKVDPKTGKVLFGGLGAHLVRALRLLELTGLRRGEALALRWEWIDWRVSVLRLPQTKSGKREIPITPQALAFLRDLRGDAVRVGLVCCYDDGRAIDPNHVGRAWRSARKAAKLDGVRLHDLRHSWASDAVSAGVPLYIVGKALGHTQPNTTARYAHLHDEAVREGLAKAGAAIEAAKGGK